MFSNPPSLPKKSFSSRAPISLTSRLHPDLCLGTGEEGDELHVDSNGLQVVVEGQLQLGHLYLLLSDPLLHALLMMLVLCLHHQSPPLLKSLRGGRG